MRKAGRQERRKLELEHEEWTGRVIGKAVGRQYGSPLNVTNAPSNPSTSLILEAFPAFLIRMSDRAASARERNGFEECAEAEDAGITLDFRQPTQAQEITHATAAHNTLA